jgi:hypothetical protein
MQRRGWQLVIVATAALGWSTLARAEAPPRSTCVGWAAAGSVAGGLATTWGTMGILALAGEDVNDPDHQTRNMAIILPAMGVGFTFGPVATCAAFGNEGNTIPAATFIIGGSLAGLGAGASAFLFLPPSEGGAGLAATIMVLTGAAGGYLGYRLHRWRLPVTPVVTADFAGVGVLGTF